MQEPIDADEYDVEVGLIDRGIYIHNFLTALIIFEHWKFPSYSDFSKIGLGKRGQSMWFKLL